MKNKTFIYVVSAVIPLAVAVLFGVKIEGYNFNFLPPIYASINGLTALVLISSLVFIKNGNRVMHERMMFLGMFLSVLFLLMYVLYHATSDSTSFGGEGLVKIVYFVILITHILLSIVVIPLVLFSIYYAKNEDFVMHKKLVKFSFPIWLYVAISGVIVYFMIAPYYIHS